MNRNRWSLALGTILLTAAGTIFAPLPSALAQNPRPNAGFLDNRPSNYNTRPAGVVVEAVGSGRCLYPWSSAEAATVRYVRARKPVFTELSPQSGCASLRTYESMLRSLVHYVESRASGARTWWAGIMLDEEPNFGFSVSTLVSLNRYVHNLVSRLPGVTWVTTEDATWAGAWSESQYNRIISGTTAAPQVYNSYMVGIVNRSSAGGRHGYNLVTWTSAISYPFNHESYVTGRIEGAPYQQAFGTGRALKWANEWRSQ